MTSLRVLVSSLPSAWLQGAQDCKIVNMPYILLGTLAALTLSSYMNPVYRLGKSGCLSGYLSVRSAIKKCPFLRKVFRIDVDERYKRVVDTRYGVIPTVSNAYGLLGFMQDVRFSRGQFVACPKAQQALEYLVKSMATCGNPRLEVDTSRLAQSLLTYDKPVVTLVEDEKVCRVMVVTCRNVYGEQKFVWEIGKEENFVAFPLTRNQRDKIISAELSIQAPFADDDGSGTEELFTSTAIDVTSIASSYLDGYCLEEEHNRHLVCLCIIGEAIAGCEEEIAHRFLDYYFQYEEEDDIWDSVVIKLKVTKSEGIDRQKHYEHVFDLARDFVGYCPK